MKKIILLIMLCAVKFCMFAQDVDTLIDIKGYYVTIFSKQEIVFSYGQKIEKEKGLSYATSIDYKQSSFFIPVQVGNKIICEKKMIAEQILNYVQNDPRSAERHRSVGLKASVHACNPTMVVTCK